MAYNSRTIRWFVTACLAFSLTLSGLAPSPMAFAEAQPEIDAPQICCCGTADSRCCGIGRACCVSQTPPPQKPVQLPTRNDHRLNLWGLSRIDAVALVLGRAAFEIRPPTDPEVSLFEASLQILHVRLDV